MLEITGLHSGYGDVEVLNGIDMAIDDGELVGIIGPNGAGKSTIFKSIMGYVNLMAGEVTFKGESVTGGKPSELITRGLAYVPQHQNTFLDMTVEENLRMGAYTLESEETYRANRETVFELFPTLEERRSQKVHTMSGGERKMVAIGRALIVDPQLVLFDEPSAGLMPKYVEQIFERIEETRTRKGIAFVIVEQNVDTLLRHVDRVYVIRDGAVVLEESGDLPGKEELHQAYLGSAADEV